MNTGGSYGSNALEAHIGLGKATSITKVVVWWQKTGRKQEFNGVSIGSTVLITENKDTFEEITLPTFSYDTSELGNSDGTPGTCH